MNLRNQKSKIVCKLCDPKETLRKLKENLPHASITKRLEISQRNEKIRDYLERRFYRQLAKENKVVSPVVIKFYKRVNGDPQFFNV